MLKLIVNPGTAQAWDIPLAEGALVLGSDPASPYPITHQSVSPAHCEIRVADGRVAIKDLGSAGGIFLNDEPVTERALAPGQTFRMGHAILQLVSGTPVKPPRPPSVPGYALGGSATSAALVCKYHLKDPATWYCARCAAGFCDLCISRTQRGGSVQHVCRKCGTECTSIDLERIESEEETLIELLPGAFAFPFQGGGAALLVAGTLFFLLLSFIGSIIASMGPYGGFGALAVSLFITGYLFNFARQIVSATAMGSDRAPDWPDFSNFQDDIIEPALQFISLILLTFGPAIVFRYWHPFGKDYADVVWLVAAVFGGLLAPMGMLALTMFDSIGALNPVTLVWSICRIPGPYFAAAAAFELALGGDFALSILANRIGVPSLLSNLITGFINLYVITAGMRILGLLYRTNKDRLGWF